MHSEKVFFTYLHCRPDGTPFYVGKGTSYRHKEFNHNRSNYYLNIIKKYGEQNILVYVFYCESEQQALKDEVQQIAQLKKEGYKLCNLTYGGDGVSGYKHTQETLEKLKILNKRIISEETRKKMSISRIGKTNIVSQETKDKISKAHLGKKLSAEHKSNLSIAMIGKVKKKGSSGFKHSAEAKEKMSKLMIGNKRSAGKKNTLGFKFSEDTKIKLSEARKGKPWTEARRLAQKGKNNEFI